MKVLIRHQKREVQIAGRRRIRELLVELGINPESVLVIRGSQLLTHDAQVGDDDTIELRPVVSGGDPTRGQPREQWKEKRADPEGR